MRIIFYDIIFAFRVQHEIERTYRLSNNNYYYTSVLRYNALFYRLVCLESMIFNIKFKGEHYLAKIFSYYKIHLGDGSDRMES